ncbi:hypothetical protein AB0Y02_16125, partial [Phocaeicola dorei]
FITEDTGGKRQTHYNIRTRVNKNGKRKKRKGRRESGGATKHRKPGQGRQLRKTQDDVRSTHN